MSRAGLALGASLLMTVGAVPMATAGPPSRGSSDVEDAKLAFNGAAYTTISVTIDGVPTPVRWYKELCYVANPVATSAAVANKACGYQSMNVFVPESAFDDPDTAIYFAVNNSGWMASYVRASVTPGASYSSTTSNVGAALKAGYVFVDVATRSRGFQAADGTWQGKAPAAAVDAKAAVRYLRLNDAAMPGSAERIVVNGTSGGGALASILGASGNSRDYEPYLSTIGAAGVDSRGKSTIRDDVFAIVAYCPITDLANADIAYEWLYNVLGTRATVAKETGNPKYDPAPRTSAQLAAAYPGYLRSLNLRNEDGTRLTADTMLDQLADEVTRSAEAFMAADPANVIPDLGENVVITGNGAGTYVNDWIDVDNATNTVVSLNLERYLAFVAKQNLLKPAPAFDQTGTPSPGSAGGPGTGESNLFGTPTQEYSNFTEYSWTNNNIKGDGIGLDDTGLSWAKFIRQRDTVVDEQAALINPMEYIDSGTDTAPYWYVRTGTRDRDTSFTVSIDLDRALQDDRDVQDVNYRLAWNQPHAGNYDVPEAMQWIAGSLAAADARLASVTVTAGSNSQAVEVTSSTIAVTVPAGTRRVSLDAVPVAEGADVRLRDSVSVSSRRPTSVEVGVRSPDGSDARRYTVVVTVAR